MKIECLNHTRVKMPRRMLTRWLKACEKKLSKKDQRRTNGVDLVVVFVSRSEIKKLNFQYRQKNDATDILSFESSDEDSLGELVLSPQVISAQAKRTGLTYHQELCYMLLHGLLHLLGYDHETSKKEEKAMFELQNRVYEHLAQKFDFR
jgi:probable rRNA maturation factor